MYSSIQNPLNYVSNLLPLIIQFGLFICADITFYNLLLSAVVIVAMAVQPPPVKETLYINFPWLQNNSDGALAYNSQGGISVIATAGPVRLVLHYVTLDSMAGHCLLEL